RTPQHRRRPRARMGRRDRSRGEQFVTERRREPVQTALNRLLSTNSDISRHDGIFPSLAQCMDPSRRRSSTRRWVIAFLVLAGMALPVSAASAGTIPDTKLGWSSCLWPAGKTITVAVDPAFRLPDAASSDRLNEAIVRWDGVLRTSRRGGDVVRIGGG